MELWIRSMDKTALMQVKDIRIYYDKKDNVQMIMIKDCAGEYVSMGVYSTKERALEVLDEIQNIIKNKFLVKCHPLMRKKDLEIAKLQIEELNNIKCIMSEDRFEIEPINKECIIYEMPKE